MLGPKIFGGAGGGKGKGRGGGKNGKGGRSGEKKVKVVVPAKLSGNYPESVKAYDVSSLFHSSLFLPLVEAKEVCRGRGRTSRTRADLFLDASFVPRSSQEEWIPASLLKQRIPRPEVVKGASIVEDPEAPSGGDEGGAQRKTSALRS